MQFTIIHKNSNYLHNVTKLCLHLVSTQDGGRKSSLFLILKYGKGLSIYIYDLWFKYKKHKMPIGRDTVSPLVIPFSVPRKNSYNYHMEEIYWFLPEVLHWVNYEIGEILHCDFDVSSYPWSFWIMRGRIVGRLNVCHSLYMEYFLICVPFDLPLPVTLTSKHPQTRYYVTVTLKMCKKWGHCTEDCFKNIILH